jgi:hypothetical protein
MEVVVDEGRVITTGVVVEVTPGRTTAALVAAGETPSDQFVGVAQEPETVELHVEVDETVVCAYNDACAKNIAHIATFRWGFFILLRLLRGFEIFFARINPTLMQGCILSIFFRAVQFY